MKICRLLCDIFYIWKFAHKKWLARELHVRLKIALFYFLKFPLEMWIWPVYHPSHTGSQSWDKRVWSARCEPCQPWFPLSPLLSMPPPFWRSLLWPSSQYLRHSLLQIAPNLCSPLDTGDGARLCMRAPLEWNQLWAARTTHKRRQVLLHWDLLPTKRYIRLFDNLSFDSSEKK